MPCGRIPRTGVITLPCPLRGQRKCPAAGFNESGVRSAVFRQRPLHQVPRMGVIALSSLLRGQPRCHSEPPRMRRVEESAWVAVKRLLCNHAYAPSLLSFRPKRGVKRRAEKSLTLYDCFYNVHLPVFYTLTLYYNPARSFDFVPRYSLVTSLRMTECTAFYAACLKRSLPAGVSRNNVPRTDIIALHNIIPRTVIATNNITMPRSVRRLRRAPSCRRGRVPRTGVIALYSLLRGQRGRICFCGAHGIILSLAQNRSFARMSGGNGARLHAA